MKLLGGKMPPLPMGHPRHGMLGAYPHPRSQRGLATNPAERPQNPVHSWEGCWLQSCPCFYQQHQKQNSVGFSKNQMSAGLSSARARQSRCRGSSRQRHVKN